MQKIITDLDGELTSTPLHDTRLMGLALDRAGGLVLSFEDVDSNTVSLVASPDSAPHVWGSGVIAPNIVSAAWLSYTPPTQGWFVGKIGQEDAAKAIEAQEIYRPGGWLLAIAMNYGGPVVVFGRRADIPVLFKIESSKS